MTEIEKVEVVGGYLNFFINKNQLTKEMLEESCKFRSNMENHEIGKEKNIVIDYSCT